VSDEDIAKLSEITEAGRDARVTYIHLSGSEIKEKAAVSMGQLISKMLGIHAEPIEEGDTLQVQLPSGRIVQFVVPSLFELSFESNRVYFNQGRSVSIDMEAFGGGRIDLGIDSGRKRIERIVIYAKRCGKSTRRSSPWQHGLLSHGKHVSLWSKSKGAMRELESEFPTQLRKPRKPNAPLRVSLARFKAALASDALRRILGGGERGDVLIVTDVNGERLALSLTGKATEMVKIEVVLGSFATPAFALGADIASTRKEWIDEIATWKRHTVLCDPTIVKILGGGSSFGSPSESRSPRLQGYVKAIFSGQGCGTYRTLVRSEIEGLPRRFTKMPDSDHKTLQRIWKPAEEASSRVVSLRAGNATREQIVLESRKKRDAWGRAASREITLGARASKMRIVSAMLRKKKGLIDPSRMTLFHLNPGVSYAVVLDVPSDMRNVVQHMLYSLAAKRMLLRNLRARILEPLLLDPRMNEQTIKKVASRFIELVSVALQPYFLSVGDVGDLINATRSAMGFGFFAEERNPLDVAKLRRVLGRIRNLQESLDETFRGIAAIQSWRNLGIITEEMLGRLETYRQERKAQSDADRERREFQDRPAQGTRKRERLRRVNGLSTRKRVRSFALPKRPKDARS
jgi:hypothetical protein